VERLARPTRAPKMKLRHYLKAGSRKKPGGPVRAAVGGFSQNLTNEVSNAPGTSRWMIASILCPGGTSDNSPTLQCWGRANQAKTSPEGTVEADSDSRIRPSLRDFLAPVFSTPNPEALGYCRTSLRDERETLAVLESAPLRPLTRSWPRPCPCRVTTHACVL
jgi:hypothetical protein